MSGIGEAEIQARLEHARSLLGEWEAGRTSAQGPDFDRKATAGLAYSVAFSLLVLGRTDEARKALRRAESAYLAWLEPQSRGLASSDWLSLYRLAVLHEWADLERRLLQLDVDPGDGRLVPILKPWVRALHALGTADDGRTRDAVAELVLISDATASKKKWYPRLGTAVSALLDADAGALADALTEICARHVSLLSHRAMIADVDISGREPAVLAAFARRRGIELELREEHRSIRLKRQVLQLTEWDGQPLGRETFEIEADITDPHAPWAFVEPHRAASAQRAKPPRSKLRSEVPEDVVREWLRDRGPFGGPWMIASDRLMLGDESGARTHLVKALPMAEQRWRGDRIDGRLNINWVTDHLSLALAVGREHDLEQALNALGEGQRGAPIPPPAIRYAGPMGHLRFLADLLRASGAELTSLREAALTVDPAARGVLSSLVSRDQHGFDEGLATLLADHVMRIDRRYRDREPVCVAAIHCIVVARRLGLSVTVDEGFRQYPVPLVVTGVPGYQGKVGHLPCDLLGEAIWEPSGG